MFKLTANSSYGRTNMDVMKHQNFKFMSQSDKTKLSKVPNVTAFKVITGEYDSHWCEVTYRKRTAENKVPGKTSKFISICDNSFSLVHFDL